MISRREFLVRTSATAAAFALPGTALAADSLNLPVGIQLYSVREQLAKDFDGTLAEVASLGYREVESAGYLKFTVAEVKQSLQKANLHCVSAHVPFGALQPNLDQHIAFNKELGVEYLICSSPGFRTPPPAGGTNRGRTMTLDDWRYNAEQFNKIGEAVKKAGMQFGYHNHTGEFKATDGVVPYLELLKLTEKSLVTMELDCGWAVVGGMKPQDLMREHPGRFSMLHVKDFKLGGDSEHPTVTELGQGNIDYAPIFAEAAKSQKIRHAFAEQEAFDVPWMESLKIDAEWLRKMKA